jgi:hypothetical protein
MLNDLTTMKFEIVPFVSVGKLKFGMTVEEVMDILGMPSHVNENDEGERVEFRSINYDILVTYDKKTRTAVEFGFGKTIKYLSFIRQNIFLLPTLEVLNILAKEDGSPYEALGIINFLNLGITVSGFHDNDDSQKAVTVSKENRLINIFDRVKENAKPFKVSIPRQSRGL